jgi:LPXTG-motif cell wall-anchored protein
LVTKANLSRRLLAGAAGLAVGLGGVFAVSAPAQAVIPDPPVAEVFIVDTCEGVDITIEGNGTNRGWRIVANGEVLHGSEHPSSLWIGPETIPSFSTFIPAAEAKGVKVEWWRSSTNKWATDEVDTVYPENGPKKHDWTNPGWPGEGCESPKVEVFKDCDGNVTVTIHAGDTRRTWKVEGVEKFIDFGGSETFDASAKDVVIKWKHRGTFVEADEKYVTRVKEDDCPKDEEEGEEEGEDTGGGGELPETGMPTALIAGGALLLLTLGGAMYVVARRRQVTFTA